MRRYIVFIGIILSVGLIAEPYKPYPILFVHGLGSNSKCWGAKCKKMYRPSYGDSVYTDFIVDWNINPTFRNFLNYMTPYAIAWDKPEYDTSFTSPGDPAYPNKTFLEVVNMDDPWGSVDNDYSTGYYISDEYTSWQDELYHRVKEVI